MQPKNNRKAIHALGELDAHFVLARAEDKRPIRKGWENPDNAPSADTAIKHLESGGLVGIVPWSLGLALVDVDLGGAKAVRQLRETLGIPLLDHPTRREGGRHLWYKADRSYSNGRWEHGDGAGDIRGGNGYAILWRTEDLTGALFQDADPVDLTPILQATNGRSRFAGLSVDQIAAAIRATAKGDRNTSLFEASVSLGGRAALTETAQERLHDAALDAGMTPAEACRTITSASKTRVAQDCAQVRGLVDVDAIPAKARPEAPRILTIAELIEEAEAKRDWLVDDLLLLESTTLIVGPPKIGKSHFARELAFAVATGQPFLGRSVKQGEVLYLSLDRDPLVGPADHFKALDAMGDEPLGWFNGRIAELHEFTIQTIQERDVKLLVVDLLLRYVDLMDGNSYAEVLSGLEAIIDLAFDHGIHVAAVYHANRSGGDHGMDALGSTGIAGSFNHLVSLRWAGNDRTISTTQRVGDVWDKLLLETGDNGRLRLGGAVQDAKRYGIQSAILDFVGQSPATTRKEILAAVRGEDALISAELTALTLGLDPPLIFTGTGNRNDAKRYSIADFGALQ